MTPPPATLLWHPHAWDVGPQIVRSRCHVPSVPRMQDFTCCGCGSVSLMMCCSSVTSCGRCPPRRLALSRVRGRCVLVSGGSGGGRVQDLPDGDRRYTRDVQEECCHGRGVLRADAGCPTHPGPHPIEAVSGQGELAVEGADLDRSRSMVLGRGVGDCREPAGSERRRPGGRAGTVRP